MDGYIGEMKMFVGTFAPMYWEFCCGQQLSITQYNSLYAIIGTQFGGDGINYFNLPDMRGRTPIGAGSGASGITPRTQGQKGGSETVTLLPDQLPVHSHTVNCNTSSTPVNTPVNNVPALTSAGTGYASGTTGSGTMNAGMVASAGGSQPHDNMSPWGCINYIICTQGIWPPQQ
jgi:microcystin-dependent protein